MTYRVAVIMVTCFFILLSAQKFLADSNNLKTLCRIRGSHIL